jgi:hypothetical protein
MKKTHSKETLAQVESAKQKLSELGFVFAPNDSNDDLIPITKWGKMAAEAYTTDVVKNYQTDLIKNNHWIPSYRDIFIAFEYPNGGCYITSSIRGVFRMKRARKYNECQRDFGNIFASGQTLPETVDNFIKAFKSKDYNVGK